MCGLFGSYCANTLSKSELERVTELGMVSSLRGIDSTGLAIIKKRKHKLESETLKALDNPVSVLSSTKAQNFLKDNHPLLVLGHARAATVGEIDEYNAHPIKEGKIIGCHNGTMWAFAPDKDKKGSDSRNLFRKISEDGLAEALGSTKSGAYALSFINTENRTLNFIRNAERPLYFMFSRDKLTLYWASERRTLIHLQMRSELGTISPWYQEEIWTLAVNHLYSIKLDKQANSGKIIDLQGSIDKVYEENCKKWSSFTGPFTSDPQSLSTKTQKANLPNMFCVKCRMNIQYCNCQMTQYTQPHDWQISNSGHSYNPTGYDKSGKPIPDTSTPVTRSLTDLKERAKNTTWNKLTHYLGFEHQQLLIGEALGFLKTGCFQCGCVCSPQDIVHWIEQKEYICDDCYKEPDMQATLKDVDTYESKFYIPGRQEEKLH